MVKFGNWLLIVLPCPGQSSVGNLERLHAFLAELDATHNANSRNRRRRPKNIALLSGGVIVNVFFLNLEKSDDKELFYLCSEKLCPDIQIANHGHMLSTGVVTRMDLFSVHAI